MRIKPIQPFDPDKQYKIGERVTCQGKTLIAVKWQEPPKRFVAENIDLYFLFGKFPTQCGMCEIKKGGCKGMFDSPCYPWSRSDRKKINFRILRNAARNKTI